MCSGIVKEFPRDEELVSFSSFPQTRDFGLSVTLCLVESKHCSLSRENGRDRNDYEEKLTPLSTQTAKVFRCFVTLLKSWAFILLASNYKDSWSAGISIFDSSLNTLSYIEQTPPFSEGEKYFLELFEFYFFSVLLISRNEFLVQYCTLAFFCPDFWV